MSSEKKAPWTCRILGWHNGKGEKPHFKEGDVLGVNLSSTCSKCGEEVIQDSQGNWFIPYSRREVGL